MIKKWILHHWVTTENENIFLFSEDTSVLLALIYQGSVSKKRKLY